MAYTATQNRPSTSSPADGSRTMTITSDPTREADNDGDEIKPDGHRVVGTLRLRGAPRKTRRKVVWDEGVIDNEGCGKKKSKICCIYHKPRRFDESSSDSDSDSDSDVGSCDEHDHGHHRHDVDRAHGSGNGHAQQPRSSPPSNIIHEVPSDDEPNAYEAIPHSRKGKRRAKE